MKYTRIESTEYIKGSRIPVSILIQYIKEGLGISDFLSSYPWVKKSNLLNKLSELEQKTASVHV